MKYTISEATKQNWKRLSVDIEDNKLKSRANKQKSTKKIIPVEYLNSKTTIDFVKKIRDSCKNNQIYEVIFSVAIKMLKQEGIYSRKSVKEVLSDFQRDKKIKLIEIEGKVPRFDQKEDFLGALYQSFLTEGEKNREGSYYTPRKIIRNMISDFDLIDTTTFLDPCCGSGAFLMSISTKNPLNLFGIEKDKIAAFIAQVNLLLSYKEIDFKPNIICDDFLIGNNFWEDIDTFDYIATNPPWGSKAIQTSNLINSKESFVHFFVKSYQLLSQGGKLSFLFPESILNVKSHKIVREFILSNRDLYEIYRYNSSFTGVLTSFVSMNFLKGAKFNTVRVMKGNDSYSVSYASFNFTNNKIFSLLNSNEEEVIKKILSKSTYSLSNSQWGLGIVTGNNAKMLKSVPEPLMEKIYTGKEIQKFKLKDAQNFIFYDRSSFQQVAKDEIYRADEKLVYKFISNNLMFAYDNSSSLFLNSANILIPNIPGMSIKTVLAFLNSTLYQFIYEKLFGELKVLKGNLIELPFPKISSEINRSLSLLVDEIISEGKDKQLEIYNIIFDLFELDKRNFT